MVGDTAQKEGKKETENDWRMVEGTYAVSLIVKMCGAVTQGGTQLRRCGVRLRSKTHEWHGDVTSGCHVRSVEERRVEEHVPYSCGMRAAEGNSVRGVRVGDMLRNTPAE